LWQLCVYPLARQLHREIEFDLGHHVTYGKYWAPCVLSLLPFPFIWGVVGGGESMPRSFWWNCPIGGKVYEAARYLLRWLSEHDPLVRLTAKRSSLSLAATPETARRLKALGSKNIEVLGVTALHQTELQYLMGSPCRNGVPFRFLSVGRLLSWKGFDLGLRAFAAANLPQSEYWILGNGSARQQLESLASQLNIADRVRFLAALPKEQALATFKDCDVLVHPSLHESGGAVTLEAMGTGLPLICLDLGGPSVLVTDKAGIKLPAHTPEQVVRDMAGGMEKLYTNSRLRLEMGKTGREWMISQHTWDHRGETMNRMYTDVVANMQKLATPHSKL